MANANEKAVKGATTAKDVKEPVKVSRRGIGSARGTQRLKFSHELAKQNGLFIGHLASVDVTMIKIGDDKAGMPSFNGLEIPRLTLVFNSNEEDVAKRRYVPLSFTAVESNAETIPGGKSEWKINQIFDWIKHVLNVYVLKGRELTEEEEASLALNFDDFDEDGQYSPVEPEVVIEGWKVLFENFANLINNVDGDKPYFKTKDGKIVPVWIKLIRYVKHKTKGWTPVNNGELSFPTFVGEGAIELFRAQQPASIRLNVINECITPKEINNAKTPNMNNPMMGGPSMGGVPMPDPMAGGFNDGFGGAAVEAGDDMPF